MGLDQDAPDHPDDENRRAKIEIDRAIYAFRNRIEDCSNLRKNARRFATRNDKLA